MKRFFYFLLLEVLKVLVWLKRGIVFLFDSVRQIFWWLDQLVVRTIGFRVYIWQKKLEKYKRWYRRLQGGRLLEFFGQRYILQTILCIMGVAIAFPHSGLYTEDTRTVPGRDTRLFAIAGPGDQDFGMEEVVVNILNTTVLEEDRAWSEGAAQRPTVQPGMPSPIHRYGTQIAGLASGGTAIVKPTILSESSLIIVTNTSSELPTPTRSRPIEYIVQPGDVLGSIAEQFNISVETILWANNMTLRSVLRTGSVLTILPTSGVLHTVRSGDTLGRIARLYDAEIGDIMRENGISNASALQIGQDLLIPGGKRIAAATPATPTQPTTTQQPSTPSTPAAPSTATPSGSGYIWPTSVRTITQYYGWRHTGVDIAGPIGSPLYASRNGTVVTSQCGWNGGYGCYIIIDHGDGFQTLYAHASELFVRVGETVTQGQTIAAMGSTGRSTGPHIHFEVRVGGRHTNPFSYVN